MLRIKRAVLLIVSRKYPYRSKVTVSYSNLVTIGLGGNIGDCVSTFEKVFTMLSRNSAIHIFSTSAIYKNKAFGYLDQPDFYNATMIFSTTLCIKSVVSLMFYVERRFGRPRIREFKNSPRALDMDVIFFNDIEVNMPHMTIPHKDFANRVSVLLPFLTQFGDRL